MLRHLTYANVMSTVGVFLALAGGYAVAQISGDGSVRSGQVENPGATPETVVSIPDFGRVTARCPGLGNTEAGWQNTSGVRQQVSVEFDDSVTTFESAAGERHEYGLTSSNSKLTFHVSRASGADVPQTVVSVTGGGFSGTCAERVAAHAVSTR